MAEDTDKITRRSTGEADFYSYGGRNFGSLAEAEQARARARKARPSSPKPEASTAATATPAPTVTQSQPTRTIGEVTRRSTGEADFYSYGGRNFGSLVEAESARARDIARIKRDSDGSVGLSSAATPTAAAGSKSTTPAKSKTTDKQMSDIFSNLSDVKGVSTPAVTTSTLGRSENIGKPATAADQAAIAVMRGYNNAPLVGEPLSAEDVAVVAQFADQVSQEKGMGLGPFGGTGNLSLSGIAEAINEAARAEQGNMDEAIVGIDAPQTGGLFGGRDISPSTAQSVANQAAISRGSFTGMDEGIAGLDSYGGEPAGPTGVSGGGESAAPDNSPSAEYSGGMDTADSGTVGDIGALFNKGGLAMEKQMKLFEEGGLSDDGMDRDPVTGNEIPPGSTAKNVRDDIPAQLSEGEYVVPADVVKYFGVKFFEDLRTRAKQGLREMDEDGRIGGEPMMPEGMGGEGIPDDIAGSIEDIDPRMLANLSEDEIRQLENIETMMPPRPRVQEVSQEDKAALAQMTGMAMGGMVAPVDEDTLIDRVIQAAKNNPNLSQKLKSRGVMMAEGGMVSQPGMMVDPYQQQKTMYSTGMAVGGLADSTTTNMLNTTTPITTTTPTFDPSQYSAVGGSYFGVGTGPVTIVEYVGPNGEILPVRTQSGRPIDPVPAGFKTKQQKETEELQESSVTAPTAEVKPKEEFGGGEPNAPESDPLGGVDFNDPVGAAQAAADSVSNPGVLGAALSGGILGTVSQLGNLSVANANALAAADIYGEDSEEAQQARDAVTAIENSMNPMAKGLKGLATGKSRYGKAKSYYDENVQTVTPPTTTRSRTQSTRSRVSAPTQTSAPSRAATPSRGGGGDIYGGAPSVSMGEPTGGDGRGSTGTAPSGFGVSAGAGAPGAGVASGGRGGGFSVGPGAGAPGSGVAASTGGIDGPAADMGSPSSESGVSGANASAPGAEVGAGPGGSDAVGPFYKGGLVKRPNRKK